MLESHVMPRSIANTSATISASSSSNIIFICSFFLWTELKGGFERKAHPTFVIVRITGPTVEALERASNHRVVYNERCRTDIGVPFLMCSPAGIRDANIYLTSAVDGAIRTAIRSPFGANDAWLAHVLFEIWAIDRAVMRPAAVFAILDYRHFDS